MSKKEFIPTEFVQKLAAQGKSEPQIISELRSHGFTPSQIDRAIKEALKAEVSKPEEIERVAAPPRRPAEPARPTPIEATRRPAPESIKELMPSREQFRVPEAKRPYDILPPAPAERPRPVAAVPKISVEELVESVVDEKWKDAEKRIREIEKRDEAREEKIEEFGSKVREMKMEERKEGSTFFKQVEGIHSEIEKMDSRVSALEKAFKEFSSLTRKKKP